MHFRSDDCRAACMSSIWAQLRANYTHFRSTITTWSSIGLALHTQHAHLYSPYGRVLSHQTNLFVHMTIRMVHLLLYLWFRRNKTSVFYEGRDDCGSYGYLLPIAYSLLRFIYLCTGFLSLLFCFHFTLVCEYGVCVQQWIYMGTCTYLVNDNACVWVHIVSHVHHFCHRILVSLEAAAMGQNGE